MGANAAALSAHTRTLDVESALESTARDNGYVAHKPWVEKCMQLYNVSQVHQGKIHRCMTGCVRSKPETVNFSNRILGWQIQVSASYVQQLTGFLCMWAHRDFTVLYIIVRSFNIFWYNWNKYQFKAFFLYITLLYDIYWLITQLQMQLHLWYFKISIIVCNVDMHYACTHDIFLLFPQNTIHRVPMALIVLLVQSVVEAVCRTVYILTCSDLSFRYHCGGSTWQWKVLHCPVSGGCSLRDAAWYVASQFQPYSPIYRHVRDQSQAAEDLPAGVWRSVANVWVSECKQRLDGWNLHISLEESFTGRWGAGIRTSVIWVCISVLMESNTCKAGLNPSQAVQYLLISAGVVESVCLHSFGTEY